MPNILDKRFKYVPAAGTDLRKTFARIRRQQRKAHAAPEQRVASLDERRRVKGGVS